MSSNTTKSVTVRFSLNDYFILLRDAERNNVAIAEMVRIAWNNHKQQEDINTKLRELEQRMMKKSFEIVAAVANLDDQERRIAAKKINKNLRED
ncbi:hypothetical protein NMT15_002448 [Vibrio cholerae]|uniref:hypothetical protein n=1 Tax=Vibrio sp. R-1 TaxID=2682542 RepID=UPI000F3DB657|nr:hypothetical protein [Vibrio sp. R-1]EHY0954110.1 hypothetical protein [Vibrio cholerae]EJL6908225.1 hypothetical protein [Vibrio cholerae]MCX9455306.1 hypothetical protein [Vibrio cholerae]MEB3775791.1 hypothetical protein [Vibrio sp. R-1]RND30473.1 hypothetical protein EC575_19650 [Vibrio cholerae]